MENQAVVAVILFILVYSLIISEKIHRTVVALAGGILMILLGIESQDAALRHIDFNTIGLLIGMMIIVNITSETGLFRFLAIWAAKKVQGQPVKILVVLSTITAICSAFLDNVTTVLLTVPITFSITKQLKVRPAPYLVSQILASNIGGTATLIGDPPNIMIGSAVKELDFMAFITNLAPVCVVIFIVTMLLLISIYRKQLVTSDELRAHIMSLDASKQIKNPRLLKKCLLILFLTIAMFAAHGMLHLESATVALTGAALLLLIAYPHHESEIESILRKVEWVAIFFFVGLFILVGGLVDTGVIALLAEKAMALTAGNLTATSMLILWMGAIASAFIDNIPFVATMIPMIKEMSRLGITQLDPLWWSLSLGACLGGNGTLVGASANVVVAGMAAQEGVPISFAAFMVKAFPLMLVSIAISSIYIYMRYL